MAVCPFKPGDVVVDPRGKVWIVAGHLHWSRSGDTVYGWHTTKSGKRDGRFVYGQHLNWATLRKKEQS